MLQPHRGRARPTWMRRGPPPPTLLSERQPRLLYPKLGLADRTSDLGIVRNYLDSQVREPISSKCEPGTDTGWAGLAARGIGGVPVPPVAHLRPTPASAPGR